MTAEFRRELAELPTERPPIDLKGVADDRRFDWEGLVALSVHPLKVAIIEALRWVQQPLSPSEMTVMLADGGYSLDLVQYHAGSLAKIGVIEVTHARRARGARESYYYFRPEGH